MKYYRCMQDEPVVDVVGTSVVGDVVGDVVCTVVDAIVSGNVVGGMVGDDVLVDEVDNVVGESYVILKPSSMYAKTSESVNSIIYPFNVYSPSGTSLMITVTLLAVVVVSIPV